ncbi:MAG: hypothetical protein PUK70_07515 [Bacteroidales bacterium]|nr:hypothetical protein [Bacteroidales bacterium]MDY6002234.1 hypothetical protein [Candidatus Cryptobacteroides sp.]
MKLKNFGISGCMSILAMAFCLTSCGDDGKDNPVQPENEAKWTTDGGLKACDHILFSKDGDANVDDNGTQIGNGDQEFVFTGKQTLKKGTYLLKGWVYIANGATLTIEPGTILKGDKETKAALIAERGGKLIAKGTADAPIVFTSEQAKGSRKPGDWGGVILCGKAKHNATEAQIEGGPRTKHGGNDDSDNSGVLSYVRIEFAGYPFETDKEINGLTLGSVGSGTQIDHVQVSFSNDDSFEWFGGTVNCKYLIAYGGWDDDFDTDNGFSGKVQFCLSIRNSRIADISQSNGFESDNNSGGTDASPHTTAVFSNVTFIGPKAVDGGFQNTTDYIEGGSYNPNNGSGLGKFQAGMHLRRNTQLSCFNSVIVGWPIGIIIDNQRGDAQGNASNGKLNVQNVKMIDCGIVGSDFNKTYKDNLITGFDANGKAIIDATKTSFSSTWFKSQKGNEVVASSDGWFDSTGYIPTSGSPLLSGADFMHSLVSSGFDKVSYIGAFSANDNWHKGWTNFDPENTDY